VLVNIVGWGERSDAQQSSPTTGTLGIALLTPTYELPSATSIMGIVLLAAPF
jgi:hypothetical protein